jgi:hypothetical protein
MLFAAVPVAGAQTVSPTDDQYESSLQLIGQGGGGAGQGQAAQPAAAQPGSAAQSGGGLPFTGLDVAGLIVAAAALGGSGLVLGHLARQRSAADRQWS